MQTTQSNNYSKYLIPFATVTALGASLYYSYKWFCPSAKKSTPQTILLTKPDLELDMKSPKKEQQTISTPVLPVQVNDPTQ